MTERNISWENNNEREYKINYGAFIVTGKFCRRLIKEYLGFKYLSSNHGYTEVRFAI
jgi:hypothetical protein